MLNHITIMGRLTHNPELRTTQAGIPVASFAVAVERDFATREGERQTDYFDCTAWRQTGEFISRYFQKGSMIVVSGRMQSRKYQDRDGNSRTAWEIQADNVYFGESKCSSEPSSSLFLPRSGPAPQTIQLTQEDPFGGFKDDEELPF